MYRIAITKHSTARKHLKPSCGKQNSAEPTVRRRQYDDRRENCRTYTHHRFSVTTAILCSSVWSASAEVFFLQGFGSIERTQNIFTQSFKKLSTAKIHFGWEFFESIFFTSCVGRKTNTVARTGKETKKKQV